MEARTFIKLCALLREAGFSEITVEEFALLLHMVDGFLEVLQDVK